MNINEINLKDILNNLYKIKYEINDLIIKLEDYSRKGV